jgi:hypothetical protein
VEQGRPSHGEKMSAESVIYYLNRPPQREPVEDTEWLFSALGQFTGAELRELLYVAQEPEFFEIMRGLFALSEESRSVLQGFLTNTDPRPAKALVDAEGRCVLSRNSSGEAERPPLKVVSEERNARVVLSSRPTQTMFGSLSDGREKG